MHQQLEEMLRVALLMMAVFMSLFVIYIMVSYETTITGTLIQIAVLAGLAFIIAHEGLQEYKLIRSRKGDDKQ